jgi:hypothetical protein
VLPGNSKKQYRQIGSKSEARARNAMMDGLVDLQMVQEKKPQEIEMPADGISLDLLRAVYRNSSLPLATRMRAAIAALPFESPKLAVTAVVSEQDFATLLDRRLKRIAEANKANKVIEAKPMIDGEGPKNRRQASAANS